MPGPKVIRRVTPSDMDARIERACRFIEQAVRTHGRRLGVEVGDYLLFHVYEQDLGYVFSRDPGKDRSLRDIAAGTSFRVQTLSRWLKAAAVRKRLASMRVDHGLGLEKLEALYRVEDIETLRALVDWAGSVPAAEVRALVRRWTAHLDQGGDPAELLVDPLPEPGPRPRRRTRTSEELIVPRLLTLLLEWVRHHELSASLRKRLLGDLVTLRTRVRGRGR